MRFFAAKIQTLLPQTGKMPVPHSKHWKKSAAADFLLVDMHNLGGLKAVEVGRGGRSVRADVPMNSAYSPNSASSSSIDGRLGFRSSGSARVN